MPNFIFRTRPLLFFQKNLKLSVEINKGKRKSRLEWSFQQQRCPRAISGSFEWLQDISICISSYYSGEPSSRFLLIWLFSLLTLPIHHLNRNSCTSLYFCIQWKGTIAFLYLLRVLFYALGREQLYIIIFHPLFSFGGKYIINNTKYLLDS